MGSPFSRLEDGTPNSQQHEDACSGTGLDDRGGLEQARHVFLAGCGLLRADDSSPAQWSGRESWQVLETGFGLGLNFLACWQAWREDPQRPERLYFTAVEAYPVDAHDILRVVAPFPELMDLADQLFRQWRAMLPGVHRLVFEGGRVQLTLLIGLAQDCLPALDTTVDSVFLDGFPVKPELRELPLLRAVARLSRPGTRLSSCIFAPALRDGLVTAGFEVEPSPGLPPKRDGLRARFAPRWQTRAALRAPDLPSPDSRSAIVVGAGLSGAACAWSLAQRGWQVQVLDAADQPAAGASALPAGLVAPHVSPDDAALSRLTRSGVRLTLQRADDLLQQGSDWAPSGVLEHRVEGKHSLPRTQLWQEFGTESSRDADASDLERAGLEPGSPALWHGLAGWLRPQQLVRAQLDHRAISWRGSCRVDRLVKVEGGWQLLDAQGKEIARAGHVVLATAYGVRELLERSGLASPPLNPLRGQISWGAIEDLPEPVRALLPQFPVNGHGCFVSGTPGPDGRAAWIAGSTFERGVLDAGTKPEDQIANRDKLSRLLPALGQALAPAFEQASAWAGLRCTLPDRVPAAGMLDAQAWPGLLVCAGMGARGLTLSVLCGELVAALLHGEPWPVEQRLAQALMADRFITRGYENKIKK
ncbi:MAG: FAD-dependent 5-carboxymethylaminomethyl-2-thiouridine(34) oxidoreductase MnmC [Pseudomonadota bacterium]|jgi:tRNA 5-methylaminomethyl-2-thiouridine biosynthesis bifunctional protein